jgi:hypothetical protein
MEEKDAGREDEKAIKRIIAPDWKVKKGVGALCDKMLTVLLCLGC